MKHRPRRPLPLYDAAAALARRAVDGAGVVASAAGAHRGVAWRGPLYAQISIADACNHRCVMCPYHPPLPSKETPASPTDPFGGARPGLMSFEVFRELIEDLGGLGTRRIDLVGRGEPLLNPRAPDMIAHASSHGLEVAMTTNGSRLDAGTVAGLISGGLRSLKISLNAARPETYPKIHVNQSSRAHAEVLAGVERVARAAGRPHLTLSFAICMENVEELDEMVRLAATRGADAAYFQHLVPVPSRPKLTLDASTRERVVRELAPRALTVALGFGLETNLSSFAREAETSDASAAPCYVGHYFTVVLGNGKVLPCCQTDRPVGDLRTDRFSALWNGPGYRAFREAARRLPTWAPELETADCDHCYFRPHNATIHRWARPLDGDRPRYTFSLRQALRMKRLDPASRPQEVSPTGASAPHEPDQ